MWKNSKARFTLTIFRKSEMNVCMEGSNITHAFNKKHKLDVNPHNAIWLTVIFHLMRDYFAIIRCRGKNAIHYTFSATILCGWKQRNLIHTLRWEFKGYERPIYIQLILLYSLTTIYLPLELHYHVFNLLIEFLESLCMRVGLRRILKGVPMGFQGKLAS